MEVNIGAEVETRDGLVAGEIERVVMEPSTNNLLSLVVRMGLRQARHIVVPIGEVERATKEKVHLRLTAEDLDAMPDFVESEYAPPPYQWVPPSIYPPAHVLVPVPGHVDLGQPTVEEPSRRPTLPAGLPHYAPAESIAISEGTEVYCTDGRIGTVDEVITDPRTNRVTSFVVRKGKWLPRDIVVDAAMVSRASEYRIDLACRKEEVNKLPAPRR